jgi:hypothetical protein
VVVVVVGSGHAPTPTQVSRSSKRHGRAVGMGVGKAIRAPRPAQPRRRGRARRQITAPNNGDGGQAACTTPSGHLVSPSSCSSGPWTMADVVQAPMTDRLTS